NLPRDARYRKFRDRFAGSDALACAETIETLCEEAEQDDIARIACRTLVIAGVRDKIIPAESCRGIAGRIAGACFREIDAAHYPHCQAPADFAGLVTEFMFANADRKERASQAGGLSRSSVAGL